MLKDKVNKNHLFLDFLSLLFFLLRLFFLSSSSSEAKAQESKTTLDQFFNHSKADQWFCFYWMQGNLWNLYLTLKNYILHKKERREFRSDLSDADPSFLASLCWEEQECRLHSPLCWCCLRPELCLSGGQLAQSFDTRMLNDPLRNRISEICS